MKVALFLPSLRGGGAERVTLALANGFAGRGFDVDLVLASAVGPYLTEVNKGVRVIDLRTSRVLASLPGLIRYLRRERPAALLSAMRHANVVAYLATRFARVATRLVVSEHNTLSRSARGGRGKGAVVRTLMRPAYRRCQGIVAVSNGVADDLCGELRLPRSSIRTIYNPVVSDRLTAQSQEPIAQVANIGRPVILAAGRLTAQKDYPTLLRAIALLRKNVGASLVILGEGELRGELERLAADLEISDYVAMPGFAENPYAWMRQADLFVMSSAWEGLPTVLIEAMACGTPVVSTDCPSGPDEILEGGKWGGLVPPGDHEALAMAMLRALENEKTPDVKLRAATFNVTAAIDAYLDLLLPARQGPLSNQAAGATTSSFTGNPR
jgi:glycosyltransferase involved in cell wall biosynthesis